MNRPTSWIVATVVIGALLAAGCGGSGVGGGGGGDIDPTGAWALGQVTFNGPQGAAVFPAMALGIAENKATGGIAMAGNNSGGAYWEWTGTYTRNGATVIANGMTEIDFGANCTMDLNLTVNGNNISGNATMHFPDAGGDYTANLNGTRQ